MFKKFFGSKKEDKPVEEVSVDPNDVEFETASLTDLENNPDFKSFETAQIGRAHV